ncbi:unnamed protein product, partial [Iphiclides podalirius]
MDKESKRTWKCPECRNKQPKLDNTNTPIRAVIPNSESIKVASGHIKSPGNTNVTVRYSKQRQIIEYLDTGITLESIRETIKEELMSIVNVQITEELKAIKQQMSQYQESITFMSKQYDDLKSCIEEKSTLISKLQVDNEFLFQRDSVLAAVIKFNKSNVNDKLSSHHLGLGGSRVPIFVAEHLTPSNKALHAATRKNARSSTINLYGYAMAVFL